MYSNFVASLLPEHLEYQALLDFLDDPYGQPSTTRLVIVDSTIDSVKIREMELKAMKGQPNSATRQSILKLIQPNRPDTKTTVVCASYEKGTKLNRYLVDALGYTFKIDPSFFVTRLSRDSIQVTEKQSLQHYLNSCPPLPSKHKHLSLDSIHLRVTATVVQSENGIPIVVILAENETRMPAITARAGLTPMIRLGSETNSAESPGHQEVNDPGSLPDRLESLMKSLDVEDIKSANSRPIEFVYPIAHAIADAESKWLYTEDKNYKEHFNGGTLHVPKLEGSWLALLEIQEFIQKQHTSLKRSAALTTSQQNPSKRTQLILEDYQELLDQAERMQKSLSLFLGRQVSMLSVEESRISIQQAEKMARLTEVATFFIPLSFTTGFFGMNFRQFGQGVLSMWLFPVLSFALIAIVTLVVWLVDGGGLWYCFPSWGWIREKRLRTRQKLRQKLRVQDDTEFEL